MLEEDVLDSFKEVLDYDDAARLLSLVCPESMKSSRYDYGSAEAFACLLHRNPALLNEVKHALELRDFEHVWDACQSYTQPRYKHFLSMNEIPGILSSKSHNFRNLVKGQIKTPFWKLTTIKTVKDPYPIVREIELQHVMEEDSIPPMLFYNLGSFKENPIQWARLQKLFRSGQNTFLVNASATGKTRLLYEGLFQHWGLYITAHADDLEARALGMAMNKRFPGDVGMVSLLPEKSALGFQRLLDGNLEDLNRRFSKVLLAHLLVFREFLKTAHAESVLDDDDLRRRWLVAQVSYPHLDDVQDLHKQLVGYLCFEPWDNIDRELTRVMEEIRPLLPAPIASDGLFVAIDEANVAAQQIWSSLDGVAEEHPVIRSIIRTLRDRLAQLGCPITLIVAGVEIPLESFPSTSPEWSSWRWTSDTGSFDERELQETFVTPFLPPSYAVTPSGEALLQRIWDWCRPRHRLTAVFMAMLLEDKMAHPHGMMDKYIKRLTSYKASDASMFTEAEGPSTVSRPFFNCIGSLVGGSILSQSATHEVVFHYILTGKHPPYFGINRLELVTCGAGQFKDPDMQTIAMDQPGVTIAAAIWLNSGVLKDASLRSFHAFCLYFNHLWQDGEAYSSASFIAWYIAHAFSDGRHLSHILSIPFPDWLKDTGEAELVILQKDKQGALKEMVVGPSALLPTSPPLGYRASTPDDVIAWLNQERTGAFCICPPDCGAELIFVLKVRGKFIWVMLRTVGRSIPPEDVDVHSEFAHLTTSGLFSTPNRSTSKRLKETLERLPNSLAPVGSNSILRVLASFPTQPRIPLILNPEAHDGPVAVLKNKTMQEVTNKFSHHDLIEGLISSMHEKRSNYDEDAFLPIEIAPQPIQKLRKGKRKDSTEDQLMGTSKTDPSESSNRLIRPIPRHTVSRPSTPTLVTEAGLSVKTEDGQPAPVSKRLKEVKSKTMKADDTVVLPRRRRSTTRLKKKT